MRSCHFYARVAILSVIIHNNNKCERTTESSMMNLSMSLTVVNFVAGTGSDSGTDMSGGLRRLGFLHQHNTLAVQSSS